MFDEKIEKLFSENIEDEENPDLSTLDREEVPEEGEEEDLSASGRDWTNLPNAKIGKQLKDLKRVKKPLESGWTVDEIMSALKPNLVHAAMKYSTPNFSKDEVLLAGMEGVMKALETDKGIAPFTSHVFPHIRSATMRAAAGTKEFPTSNISGIKPHEGGKTDFLKGAKATVSADVPAGGDEGAAPYSANISGDPTSGARAEKEQMDRVKLLSNLFSSPEVGLSDTEKVVMLATFGINPKGQYSAKGAQSTSDIADAFGVSKVRISQIRKKATDKLRSYLASRGLESPEDAMAVFGMEEAKLILAAGVVIESMSEIIKIEMELMQEHLNVSVDVDLGGIVRHAVAKVNTGSFSVDDIVAEGNESILSRANGSVIDNAKKIGRVMMSKEYFSETVGAIVQMRAQPVLAVINAPDNGSDEDKSKEDEST